MRRQVSSFVTIGLLLVGTGAHQAALAADEIDPAGSNKASTIGSPTVELTWTENQLAFLSNQVMTVQPPNVPAPPQVDGSVGSFNLESGQASSSNRRDFWLHEQTAGWTDTRVYLEGIDPLFFGPHPELGNVLPQGGVVVRFQHSNGKNRGITLNNNIFGRIGILNVGVWEANPDGTEFRNRQTSFDIGDSPPFPYGLEAILNGNIIRVRVFAMGEEPPSWEDPDNPRVREIDLDIEAGDASLIPTPTGEGAAGVVAAHAGADPLAAVRLHRVEFENLD